MDLIQSLKDTSRRYAPVPFYWWNGDRLEKKRLLYQLDQLAQKGVGGVNINYIHKPDFSQETGDPPLFSEEWWELWTWFVEECGKRGMAAGFDDYIVTSPIGLLGKGILERHSELRGYRLLCSTIQLEKGQKSVICADENQTFVTAIARNGTVRKTLQENETFTAEQDGWSVSVITYVREGVNAFDKRYAEEIIAVWLAPFEKANPGQMGKSVNYFFQDEVDFHLTPPYFTPELLSLFREQKGYELKENMDALFLDIGNLTEKVRLDYYEVALELLNDRYFKPICSWMDERGILFGCDNNSRGEVEDGFRHYIDYFRVIGNYSAPGADDAGPSINRNLFSGKVASSIAHLYRKPRAWVEGYHSCGWGITPQQLTAFTNENFMFGYNLLNLHGLYYSTHGGWFEWAPPDFHFRQPFWNSMEEFNIRFSRLANLLTQGVHKADVALYYPASSAQAGCGEKPAAAVKELADFLFRNSVDFDFVDDASLQNAEINENGIQIGEETYRYLILPNISVIRYSVFEKIRDFQNTIAYRSLPSISDRVGRNDPMLQANHFLLCQNSERLLEMLQKRDFCCDTYNIFVLHRKIGEIDVYAVYNANEEKKKVRCCFSADGDASLLDIISLETEKLPEVLTLAPKEMKLVVFHLPVANTRAYRLKKTIPLGTEWDFQLAPTLDNRFHDFRAWTDEKTIGAEARAFFYSENKVNWERVVYSDGPRFLSDRNEEICFSKRLGIIKDPHLGHWLTGPHGLKCKVPNEFIDITMDHPGEKKTIESYVTCDEQEERYFLMGSRGGYQAFLNGELMMEQAPLPLPVFQGLPEYISPVNRKKVTLQKGTNRLRILCTQPEQQRLRLFAVFSETPEVEESKIPELKWFRGKCKPYDIHPGKTISGYYKIATPPGFSGCTVRIKGELLSAALSGNPLQIRRMSEMSYHIVPEKTVLESSSMVLEILQSSGYYKGAAFLEPVRFTCQAGKISCGNWIQYGLSDYSGGGVYSKTVEITHAADRVELCTGKLGAAAKITVNGHAAGNIISVPWTLRIEKWLHEGENEIKIEVTNTLANHYNTDIPTSYVYEGQIDSGLLMEPSLLFYDEV